MARSHPGEPESSHVLKGFMEELLDEKCDWGKFIRHNFVLIIVPMINPDGVSIGNSKCSLSGHDLDKYWRNPDRFIHPEIYYTKKVIENISKNNKVVFMCDFFGSDDKIGNFLFANTLEGLLKETRVFPYMMYNLLAGFEKSSCK